jgi:hypothetical protein
MENPMIGKTILAMKIAEDRKAILFVTDAGDVIAKTDGDCCSNSWVENIETPAMGFPAKVLAIEDLNMPDLGQPVEYDVLAYYGCKVSTDKGDFVIDYRNSSNGYYGGNLYWPGMEYDHFYGGVYGQNISKNEWKDL